MPQHDVVVRNGHTRVTLPAGPFLAYDHQGKLVSTIYVIPLKNMQDQKEFGDLASPGGTVDHVSIYYRRRACRGRAESRAA